MSEKRLQTIAPIVAIALLFLLLYFLRRRGNEEILPRTENRQTGQIDTAGDGGRDKWRRLTLKEIDELSATIRGTVTRADNGSALHGVAVSWEVPYSRNLPSRETTRSGLDGTYELKPLLAETRETFQLAAKSGRWLTRRREVEIRIGDTLENVNFILTDTTDIMVTLLDVDDDSPVLDAEIILLEPKTKKTCKSDSRTSPGDYLFKNIRKNHYRIKARAEGYVELTTGLKVEEENQKFQFHLEQCACLSGRVTDTSGNPIAGASVYFRMAGGVIVRTVTDENGDYIFERLKPCQGEIGAEHPDYAKRVDAVLEIEKGEWLTHDIVLAEGVSVFGTVKSLSGAPIAGAAVRMVMGYFHTGMRHIGKTDKDGKYRFEKVAPAEYHFEVRANGYIPQHQEHFHIEADAGNLEKNFVLAPGGTISGRVQDSAGVPVAGVRINTAETQFGGLAGTTISDENGDFEIGGLPLDRNYNVIFIPKNNAYHRIPDVPPNRDLGVVTLESYGSLKGKVVWNNTPLPDVEVLAWKMGDPSFKDCKVTDENGVFYYKQIRPGTYHLEVNAEGFRKHAIDDLVIEEHVAKTDLIINVIPLRPR